MRKNRVFSEYAQHKFDKVFCQANRPTPKISHCDDGTRRFLAGIPNRNGTATVNDGDNCSFSPNQTDMFHICLVAFIL